MVFADENKSSILNQSIGTLGLRRRRRIVRYAGYVVAVAVVVIMEWWFVRYLDDSRLRQRLIGSWTQVGRRDDGSGFVAIWEFRPDGTVREYPVGKPMPETGRLDDYLQWDVEDGALVLSWCHLFSREADISQRIRQVEQFVTNRWKWKKGRWRFADRCEIEEDGADKVILTLDRRNSNSQAWIQGRATLTRTPPE